MFFYWTNIRESTIIPRMLSLRGKMFFLQVRGEKKLFKELKYDPLKLCKNSCLKSTLGFLNATDLVFLPIFTN